MLRRLIVAAAFVALTSTASAAETTTYFGFHIGISNAPPPPRIVYREEPEYILVSGTNVYIVEDQDHDCDVFRVGSYWYVMSDGHWYRARSHRGPFVVIDVRKVPRAVFATPSKYWKHHPHGGPPGQMKKHDREHGRAHTASSKHKH